MGNTDGKSLERIVLSAEECGLSNSSLNEDLSVTGMDESTGRFFSTVDKLAFRSLVDVVSVVLKAQKYALNLENLLASLEQCVLGYRVRLKSQAFPPVAKSHYPCIQFQLPVKNRVGPLLKKLYEEVEKYESELNGLRQKLTASETGTTNSQLTRENKKILKENQELSERLMACSQEVSELRRAHKDTAQALADQNLLPRNIRRAAVKQVNWDNRSVTLLADGAMFDLWLGHLSFVPSQGQSCLARFEDGNAVSLFVAEGEVLWPETRIAEVLYVEQDALKLRDESRREWNISAANPQEKEAVQRLFRGDRVILDFVGDFVMRFRPCPASNQKHFQLEVQDALEVHDASRALRPVGFRTKKNTGGSGDS